MIREDTLPVNEVFGPTWQGEGPACGRVCGFLRLGLCNLTCQWCDTPYTWDRTRYDVGAENPPRSVAEVAADIRALRVPLLVVSGGEPLIHARRERDCPLGVLLWDLLDPGLEIHVETNATLSPPLWLVERVAHFSVSPKTYTRDPESKRVKAKALTRWSQLAPTGKVALKYVAATPGHVDLAAIHAKTWGFAPADVWVMPEGTESTDVVTVHRKIGERVAYYGFNTTTRLHVLLWGNEKGR